MKQHNIDSSEKESYDIYHDLIINTSIENVFKAVTKPEQLINWWPLKCKGNAAVGEEYNFYFTPDYNWFGQVSEYKENSAFHIKMTRSDSDWDPTSFGFDMKESDGKVQLQFWHVGWPQCNAHYKRSSYCWAILLNGLKNYVEKGIVIPFEDRE